MDKTCLERRINCKQRWLLTLLLSIVLFCLLESTTAVRTTCGGYFSIGSGTTEFYSPNYPATYDVATNCIWIIESSSNHRVNFTFSFTGERYDGACSDFIQIRDGGPSSAIMGNFCDTHTDVNVESSNVWLSVQLKTDQITGSGTYLTASAKAVYNNTTPYIVSDQVKECRSYQFECANRVCISMSYRCDDYNDCGCIDDCDEDGCGSLPIDLAAQVGISVAVGIVVFITICLIAYLIEGKNSWSTHKKKIILEKNKAKPKSSQAFIKIDQTSDFDSTTPVSSRVDYSLKVTDCEA